jgi:hypothetical protein
MKARHYLLGCLALTACDATTQLEISGPVVVSFAQPFPANVPDLPGFLPRDWGRYATPADTGSVFVLSENALVTRYAAVGNVAGGQLDSLGLPRHAWSGRGPDGLHYRVITLAADSFRLQAQLSDTVLDFTGPRAPRLRYYHGYYYTSTPAYHDSTKWTVRRLAVANGRLTQQLFNPDSLRVRALDPAAVQQRRAGGQLFITLSPQSRRAIGQVSSYGGLWLDMPADSHLEVVRQE